MTPNKGLANSKKENESSSAMSAEAIAAAAKPVKDYTEWSLPVLFLKKMIEMLLETCEKKLPRTAGFKSFHIAFLIPETNNIGAIEIECLDPKVPDARLLKTVVFRRGTDVVYNHFMKKGSSEDIKAYLRNEENFTEIYDSIHELSDSVNAS